MAIEYVPHTPVPPRRTWRGRTLRRATRASAVALVALALTSRVGRAENHTENCASRMTPKSEPKARALAAQGETALDDGRFADALQLYERAFCVRPDPALKHQISATELRLGRCQEALADARFWVAHVTDDDDDAPKKWLDTVLGQCIEVTIRSTPGRATFWLDDATVSLGHSPWHGWVTPGDHVVTASADGFADVRHTFKVPKKSKGSVKITVDLAHASGAAGPSAAPTPEKPPSTGSPAHAGPTGQTGDAPSLTPPPPAEPALPEQAVHPREDANAGPPMSLWRKVGIGATAVGAAGLIAATVLAVTAQSATKAGQTQAATSSVQGRVDSVNTRINGADALFGIGGALAAAGVTLTVVF